jgi:uncharacterized protein (DUF1684 family)
MKKIIIIAFYLVSCRSNVHESSAIEDINLFQNKINMEFSDKKESPLTEEDFKTFESLDFFPIDTTYRVVAKLKYFKDSKPFNMKTTTDRLAVYKVFASATFDINDNTYVLQIYQSQQLLLTDEYKNYLFLPFTDETNGESSYGGGRFIDLKVTDKETIIIDFNKSYNPYCAYSDRYSCPIPPKVNHLNVKIPAGVMTFKGH